MRHPLTLVVGPIGSTDIRAFAPAQAEPPEILIHRRDEFRPATCLVEVIIAQNERAAGVLRTLLGDPKGPRVTEMQVTCRGWRETSAIH